MTSATTKSKVFVTRVIPDHAKSLLTSTKDDGLELDIDWWGSEEPIPRAELLKRIKGVDGIYCILEDKIDAELLDAAGSSLKVVSSMSVGVDHIDINECRKRNVLIGNTPGVLTETTADLTLALMLATGRRLIEGVGAVKTGQWTNWKPLWLCGTDLSAATVGIVGFGRIGAAVANRLSGFGCRILYSGRKQKTSSELSQLGLLPHVNVEYASFDELLGGSEFVSVTCALTPETRNLFSTEAFSKMKPTSVLINTSRGGVVDQDALYKALHEGKIRAAGLDVTSPEPLPTNHPLLTLPNCVILPHIGSASIATRNKMADIAARNLIAGVSNKPLLHQV